jgi:hypothetical protein
MREIADIRLVLIQYAYLENYRSSRTSPVVT